MFASSQIGSTFIRPRIILACLAVAFCSAELQAQVFSADASIAAEATIYENEAGNNGGGYGTFVCMGNLDAASKTRRAYLRFNLPEIPSGATITRVVLAIKQVRVRHNGSGAPKAVTMQVHRVNSDWTEGTGNGQQAACGGGGNVAGVDWTSPPNILASMSGSEPLPTQDNVIITLDTDIGSNDDGLLGDVQAWVDSGASNFGWMLRVTEEDVIDNARLILPQTLTVYWTVEGGAGGFTIDAGVNGNWWNGPDRSGEGVQVEVSDGGGGSLIMVTTVYSYNTMGKQIFMITVGPVVEDSAAVDVFITEGGLWGDDFDPSQVIESQWGTGTFSASSCDAMHMELKPNATYKAKGYTDLMYDLIRLTSPAAPCPADNSN